MERERAVAGDSEQIGEFVTDCVSSESRGMSLRTVVVEKKRRRLVACASDFRSE